MFAHLRPTKPFPIASNQSHQNVLAHPSSMAMICKNPLSALVSLALCSKLVSSNLYPFHSIASDEASSHHKLSWTAIHSHPWLHTFSHIQVQARNVEQISIEWTRRRRIMWKESTCLI